ncbi:MAG: hypothetical protein Q8M83_01515 [bacterium]|nr:hypothetical protein [bacterium]
MADKPSFAFRATDGQTGTTEEEKIKNGGTGRRYASPMRSFTAFKMTKSWIRGSLKV